MSKLVLAIPSKGRLKEACGEWFAARGLVLEQEAGTRGYRARLAGMPDVEVMLLSAGEIASHFEVTRPAVSQDLTLLKEAGLVDERRNGTRRLYRARPEGLADLRAFLEEFWDARLEALKREAEREERTNGGADD